MSFKNWPIIAKIAILISILGLSAVAGTLLASSNMRDIGTSYARLLTSDSRAVMALSRMNRQVVWVERSFFEAITATTDESNKAARDNIDRGITSMRQRVNEAKAALPARATEFDAMLLGNHGRRCSTLLTVYRAKIDIIQSIRNQTVIG